MAKDGEIVELNWSNSVISNWFDIHSWSQESPLGTYHQPAMISISMGLLKYGEKLAISMIMSNLADRNNCRFVFQICGWKRLLHKHAGLQIVQSPGYLGGLIGLLLKLDTCSTWMESWPKQVESLGKHMGSESQWDPSWRGMLWDNSAAMLQIFLEGDALNFIILEALLIF